jgi:hypothetical protein
MTLIRALLAVAISAAATIGPAAPASAEPLSGPYTRTITDKSGGPFHIGGQTPWILGPCGPSCLHIHQAVDPEWATDVHLQGNARTGAVNENRTMSFDKDTLVGTDVFTKGDASYTVGFTLTKA